MQRFVMQWNAFLCKESPEQWKAENEWHKKKKKKKKKEEERERRMPLSLRFHSKPSDAGLHKAKVASQHC